MSRWLAGQNALLFFRWNVGGGDGNTCCVDGELSPTPDGSWLSCNFHVCLATFFSLVGFTFSFSHSTQLHRHVLPPAGKTRIGLAITTVFDSDSQARRHILGILDPVQSVK